MKRTSNIKNIAGLRKKAEQTPQSRIEQPHDLSGHDIQRLIYELGTQQIELEMQNEELRKAFEELDVSRRNYADLYDFAPVGYLTLDTKGVVLEANLTAAKLLGVQKDRLIKKPFSPFIADAGDQHVFRALIRDSVHKRTLQRGEIKLVQKNGPVFHALLECIVAYDPKGNVIACRAALSDVTGRRQTEEELKKYREHLEELVRERTKALGESNRLLRQEITVRKQAEEFLLRAKEDLEVRVRERTEILSKTNELLKLFTHTFLKKEYLDAVTELLSQWCDCECAAIRLIDENGNIPYIALKGFSRKFWEQEHCLSIKKDFCICTRIITEKPSTAESPFLTPSGSFFCNDTSLLRPVRGRGRVPYRGACIEHGFVSLAVIPIRHRGTVLGTIHLVDKRKKKFLLLDIELIESVMPLIGEALYRFSVEEALFASRQQLRNLSAHLLAAREEERRKIAREIHDELGQTLTAASMELGRIYKKGGLIAPVSECITSASNLIDTAVEDIQRICSDLRPRVLDHLGLKAAIEWQSKRFSLHTGIHCHLKLSDSFKQLPDTVSTTLFRIFQETLTNVGRHSGASEVTIFLGAGDSTLILRIRDNGKGVSKQQLFGEQALGILGIRERAHDLGGTVTFRGIRKKGTTITVKIPLDKGGGDVYNSYRRRSSDRPAGT
jgi:PAS domain S-box-containing protein